MDRIEEQYLNDRRGEGHHAGSGNDHRPEAAKHGSGCKFEPYVADVGQFLVEVAHRSRLSALHCKVHTIAKIGKSPVPGGGYTPSWPRRELFREMPIMMLRRSRHRPSRARRQ